MTEKIITAVILKNKGDSELIMCMVNRVERLF
jgi:hypothetical protein